MTRTSPTLVAPSPISDPHLREDVRPTTKLAYSRPVCTVVLLRNGVLNWRPSDHEARALPRDHRGRVAVIKTKEMDLIIWYTTIKWGTESIKRSRTIKYLWIILDEKFIWAAPIKRQGMKTAITRQRIARIVGVTWGVKQEHRRILYYTVAERMILHGAVAWVPNLTSRQKKLLLTIQRKFLLFITGAYRTT
ncbi:hypothetical protein AVEN_248969-1 [Araneus ventricosus]|uniref:Uncharacterized protein n=1 Tax=Araneus ventricosus TaxID=182803 RepID=A0A4Y2J4I7_ARAVE|nr:hypothetical protein AVEN_248969-1 [Araneus ventricosus]